MFDINRVMEWMVVTEVIYVLLLVWLATIITGLYGSNGLSPVHLVLQPSGKEERVCVYQHIHLFVLVAYVTDWTVRDVCL